MAKVTPITEHFQYFVSELKESFWGDLQGDRAFCFYYEAGFDELRRHGAELWPSASSGQNFKIVGPIMVQLAVRRVSLRDVGRPSVSRSFN